MPLSRSDDLIREARERAATMDAEHDRYAGFGGPSGGDPGSSLYRRLADALEAAESRATEAEADREHLKGVVRRLEQERADERRRLHAERDAAVKELRDRELHHFEVEQDLAAALAVIEKARTRVSVPSEGSRVMAEKKRRPQVGEVWQRRRDKRDGDGLGVKVTVTDVRGNQVWWALTNPRWGAVKKGFCIMSTWITNYVPTDTKEQDL